MKRYNLGSILDPITSLIYEPKNDIYSITMRKLNNKENIDFSKFRGHPILILNVASH
jgi:hypothetical protein